MKLLHFAHRLEAKAFFDNSDFVLIKEAKNDLYYSKELHLALLISGEGHLNALESSLQSILFFDYQWKEPVSEIINLGICGALNPKLKKETIVLPRCSLLVNTNHTPAFQTYETHNEINAISCLTTEERIQSTQLAEKLNTFGDIVDRELWGVLRAANLTHLPVYSVKVVSDNAREVTCELIKDEAHHFSKLLKQWFDENIAITTNKNENKSKNQLLDVEIFLQKANIYQHPLLHFSQTQKHQIKKLYHGLKIQNESEEKNFLQSPEMLEIFQLEWTPKKRATEIISLLQSRLNPYMANWQKDFQELTKPLRRENIQLHIDPKLESTQTTIIFDCKNESDFNNKLKALSDFSYKNFNHLMHGHHQKSEQ